jgi:hypothetical protein
MSDHELNNFFKPAKELLKKLPKSKTSQNFTMNTELDLKKLLIHPSVSKNANCEQKSKLNSIIEELSKQYEKMSMKVPIKNVFDREYLLSENETLKKVLKKRNLDIDELRFSNQKLNV